MSPDSLTISNPCVQTVTGFEELVEARFSGTMNALCWPRTLDGNFAEVVEKLGEGTGMVVLEAERLRALDLSEGGRLAVETMLKDVRCLESLGLEPVLNCIYQGYHDGRGGPVATDVYSWHVDSAPVEADTWLCTYHGASSEGLRNDQAKLKVEIPELREVLLRMYGGPDDAGFREYLNENCYDLHYAPVEGARTWEFGTGNLWRIAAEWPGSPVLPGVHRAPEDGPGHTPRLLLIS